MNPVVPLRGTRKARASESVGCAALHPRLFKCNRYAVKEDGNRYAVKEDGNRYAVKEDGNRYLNEKYG
jgi:hypothetical protein